MDNVDTDAIKKLVSTLFKFNGLQVRSDATSYLVSCLADVEDEKEMRYWAEKIVDRIIKMKLKSPLVDRPTAELAAKECGRDNTEKQEDIVNFIPAFDVPKYTYNADKKKFLPYHEKPVLFSNADAKSLVYRNRYEIILQRTYHNELFSPVMRSGDWDNSRKKFVLRPIEYLAGSNVKVDSVIVLGMITQLKERKYYLEDPTGVVELDLSDTKFHTGLYAENCFVLAEGMYNAGTFYVKAMGLPPPESSMVTRSYHGSVNFFGGLSSSVSQERLEILERQNEGAMFVALAEVHLDKRSVLEKLKVLFSGYSDSPPVLFIFMGNFLSEPYGVQGAVVLKDCFKSLADLILQFPLLAEHSKFIIIPGPADPGFVNILPRPPFAECITNYFQTKVRNAVFATNPFRIKYCTKEVVVFREDNLTKLCRNSIYFPSGGNIPKEFISTLVGQAHLYPLPMHICPVYWNYDHSLSLYPLPDLVILGDKYDPFTVTNTECIFTNTGSFVKTDFSFKVYSPFENNIEDCQLPQED